MGRATEEAYCKTLNWYRWEFLRRSQPFKAFYARVTKEYLQPLRKYKAALKVHGKNDRQIFAGRFGQVGPASLVDRKEKLHTSLENLSKIAHKEFGLSWHLIRQHYKDLFPDARKPLKDNARIVFADYQHCSPHYNSLKWQPVIKRIDQHIEKHNFDRMRADGFVFFALNTWGERLSPDNFKSLQAIICEHISEGLHGLPPKNPFLLSGSETMTGRQLKLQASKLGEHFEDMLKAFDIFEDEISKPKTTKTRAYMETAERLSLSEGAARRRIEEAQKLINEAARGRFYPSQSRTK